MRADSSSIRSTFTPDESDPRSRTGSKLRRPTRQRTRRGADAPRSGRAGRAGRQCLARSGTRSVLPRGPPWTGTRRRSRRPTGPLPRGRRIAVNSVQMRAAIRIRHLTAARRRVTQREILRTRPGFAAGSRVISGRLVGLRSVSRPARCLQRARRIDSSLGTAPGSNIPDGAAGHRLTLSCAPRADREGLDRPSLTCFTTFVNEELIIHGRSKTSY